HIFLISRRQRWGILIYLLVQHPRRAVRRVRHGYHRGLDPVLQVQFLESPLAAALEVLLRVLRSRTTLPVLMQTELARLGRGRLALQRSVDLGIEEGQRVAAPEVVLEVP